MAVVKKKRNKTLRVLETFAGIGAQHKAITRINALYKKPMFKVVATCEWDIFCNISYDAIHSNKKAFKFPSPEKMREFLSKYTWSKNTKDEMSKTSFKNLDASIIERLYKSVKVHNNFGSIIHLKGEDLIKKIKDFDVLTYSFPCQNLSTAGAFYSVNTGMSKQAKSRSGLLWEIERILLELAKLKKLPKYLILENVKAMIFKKNIEDYKSWLEALEKLGYKTNTKVLKATEFGIPQSRERVFALSILNYKGKLNKDGEPDINYQKKPMQPLKDFIKFNKRFKKEYLDAEPNNTQSRIRMRDGNPKLELSKTCRTITTKQDRHPNCGTIAFPQGTKRKKDPWRFITPREGFMLMGFDSNDYSKVKKVKIKNSDAYLQAGNSIVVSILEAIFTKIIELENI